MILGRMKRTLCILSCVLWGISAHAQTLTGTLGAIGVAGILQGIGSNAASIGMGAVNGMQQSLPGMMGGNTPGLGGIGGGGTGGGATTTPAPTPPTPTPTPGPASVPVPTAVPAPTITPGLSATGSCSPTTLLPEITRNWRVLAAPLLRAQPPRPAVFGGTVTVDGSTVPNGTGVLACIDGTLTVSTSVSGGNWHMSIAEPPGQSFEGKTITFKIGDITARETAVWTANGGGILNLTATSGS